ncbi:MAG: hypothetical protein QXI64_10620 [Sulfolobales archaeon]
MLRKILSKIRSVALAFLAGVELYINAVEDGFREIASDMYMIRRGDRTFIRVRCGGKARQIEVRRTRIAVFLDGGGVEEKEIPGTPVSAKQVGDHIEIEVDERDPIPVSSEGDSDGSMQRDDRNSKQNS